MKTVQESLGDEDGKSEMAVTFREVWLGWKEKLCKFWEEQFGLLEGKVGMLCAFSRMNEQRGWTTKFAQFYRGTGQAA